MKSLKKASIFTPLAGQVSTKAPGAVFPPPGPRALTGPDTRPPERPVEKASMVLIHPSLFLCFQIFKTSAKGQNISVKLHMLKV